MRPKMGRWWIYQRERFPLLAHGPLILAFSLCAVCYSSLLRGAESFPALPTISVAFITALISFLHLRLADEFKDFDDDSRYRPYRPVPRGLITLRELGVVWVATGVLQATLALLLKPLLLLPLVVTWVYLALMSREFFCRDWLKSHPFTYMWTHMFIMPLIDFYATACDWLVVNGHAPRGLWWFVIVSFFNGFIIEIGRKIRAPHEEEAGVETYTVLWRPFGAVRAWWVAMGLTFASALMAAAQIGFTLPVACALGSVLLVALGSGFAFLKRQKAGKPFEIISGVWTLVLYLSIGIAPLTWKLLVK